MNRLTLLCLLLLLVIMPAAAQDDSDEDETHPLLEMLALIPDTQNSRVDLLSYVDYRAVERARRTVISPPNFLLFDAMAGDARRLWVEAFRRVQSGPPFLSYLMQFSEMPEVVGFDFFDIDRAISFGQPPSQGMILGGDFNADAISEAHAARNYTEETLNGFTAWCGPEGCDSGMMLDPTDRNPANIFDPSLGRKPPVLIVPGYLVSSPDLDVVNGVARAAAGRGRTLLDDDYYRALAQAITDPEHYSGVLVQVNFLNYDVMADVDLTIFETREDYDAVAQGVIEAMFPLADEWLDYGTLPRYAQYALVDRQEGETQVAIVALVYRDEDDARIAAEELATRIGAYRNEIIFPDSETPLMNNAEGAAVDEPYVYISEDTGLAVAVASISYPLPTVEGAELSAEPVEGQAPPSVIYRAWIQAVFQRAFYPVWNIKLPAWAYEDAG